jgi:hypothetical protein
MKLKTNAFALRAARVAHLSLGAVSLAAVAMAWMPQTMQAQNLILDNFETGGGKVAATTGVQTVTQTGTGIYGGFRQFTLTVQNGSGAGTDPYQQPVQVQVRPSNSASDPSALLWSVGYGAAARIDLWYPGSATTENLNLNLSGYDRLRVDFSGLTAPLNFNIEAFDTNGLSALCGINLGPSGYNSDLVPFTVDFPISAFTFGGQPPQINWANIDLIDVIFQGAPNLAITKFLAIPNGSSEAPATVTCAPPAT